MNIAIVDDEIFWQKSAFTLVNNFFEKNEYLEITPYIRTFSSGKELLSCDTVYDVIILDVEMPQLNGFELAEQYRLRNYIVTVIMLTVHTHLSSQGYLVEAFRYIDKANMEKELNEAFRSLISRMSRNKPFTFNVVHLGSLTVMSGTIKYLETVNRHLKIHTHEKSFQSNMTISQAERQLTGLGFFRCHRCYLINLDYIQKIQDKQVYLQQNIKIPVPSHKIKALKDSYIEWIEQNLNI